MSSSQISGVFLILEMMLLLYLATSRVSSVSFNGKGLYHITVNAIFRGNKTYCSWLVSNQEYLWYFLIIISICPTILILIEPFRQNQMALRPEHLIYYSVPLWLGILMVIWQPHKAKDI